MLKSKKCSDCGETKAVSNFFKRRDIPDGYAYQCKQCYKEYYKKYYQKNKEKILAKRKIYYQNNRADRVKQKADYRKRCAEENPYWRTELTHKNFAREYKIPFDGLESWYKKQWMKQQAACAICGVVFGDEQIDHDHKKQGVDSLRGLLCRNCNSAIGFLKDNPIFCENAGDYLRKYS